MISETAQAVPGATADICGSRTVYCGIKALRAAGAELHYRSALRGADYSVCLCGNETLMVDAEEHHRLHELSLHYRAFDGDYRLAREYRSTLRDSINITAEFKIGEVIEKLLGEASAAQIFDILGRKFQPLEVFAQLLNAGHDDISAAVGHLAEEHIGNTRQHPPCRF